MLKVELLDGIVVESKQKPAALTSLRELCAEFEEKEVILRARVYNVCV